MTRYSLQVPSIMGHTTLEKIFDEFWGDTQKAIDKTTSGYPVTDIYKDGDEQIIEMALAGFSRDMIDIDIEGNKITISSEGSADNERVSRIARRSFRKEYTDYNNNCDLERSKATFENGLLRVVIPPKNKKISRKIEII